MRKAYQKKQRGAGLRQVAPAPEATRTKVLAVGDVHLPFHSVEWMRWLFGVARRVQPDVIVQMGDVFDLYSWSRYPRTHNAMTPREEHEEGRKGFLWFWSQLREAAPGAELLQLRGNHDARPMKRVLETLPAGEDWVAKGLADMFEAPGVSVVNEAHEELEIDGVLYTHGHTSHGRHAPWLQQSTVHGHTHRGAVTFWQQAKRTIFELDCGWGADIGKHADTAFSYYAFKRMHGTNLGVGLVDSDGPRFVPMAW